MFETTLDNGYDEVEVEIDFDYQPYEPQEWGYHGGYPGCPEGAEICEVKVVDTQAELCILPQFEMEFVEQILEHVHEEQAYAKYGYLMD